MATIRNFFVDTTKGVDLIKVIHEIRRVVKEANTENGVVTIIIPTTGAGLAILDTQEKLDELKKVIESQLPSGMLRFQLPKTLSIPFEKGKMLMEPWQEVFLIDYESSARRREFKVSVVGEAAQPAAQGGRGGFPGLPPGVKMG